MITKCILILFLMIISQSPCLANEINLNRFVSSFVKEDQRPAVTVRINGEELYMLLDTKSDFTILKSSVSKSLGLAEKSQINTETVMGTVVMSNLGVQFIELAENDNEQTLSCAGHVLTPSNSQGGLFEETYLHAFDGILGINHFHGMYVTIDPLNEQIRYQVAERAKHQLCGAKYSKIKGRLMSDMEEKLSSEIPISLNGHSTSLEIDTGLKSNGSIVTTDRNFLSELLNLKNSKTEHISVKDFAKKPYPISIKVQIDGRAVTIPSSIVYDSKKIGPPTILHNSINQSNSSDDHVTASFETLEMFQITFDYLTHSPPMLAELIVQE